MLGKTIEIFFRFCAILKAFNAACDEMAPVQSAIDLHLTEELHRDSERIIQKFHRLSFCIDADTVSRAIRLTEYFNKHKLILATYAVNPQDEFDDMINKIFIEQTSKPRVSGVFQDLDAKLISFMRRIILSESSEVIPSMITNGNGGTDTCVDAMKKLSKLGLGTIVYQKSANNRRTLHFTKIRHQIVQDSSEIGQLLQSMGLNLQEIVTHLLTTEQSEQISLNQRVAYQKRNASTPRKTPGKRIANRPSPLAVTNEETTTTSLSELFERHEASDAQMLLEHAGNLPLNF